MSIRPIDDRFKCNFSLDYSNIINLKLICYKFKDLLASTVVGLFII